MRPIILLALFLAPTFLHKSAENKIQDKDCNCLDELVYVADYYSENLASYDDYVVPDPAAYAAIVADLKSEAKEVTTRDECYTLINEYVELFKDKHARLMDYEYVVDLNKDTEINEFVTSAVYKDWEILDMPRPTGTHPIGGTYQSLDGALTMQISPDAENKHRDFVGVITKALHPIFKPGHVVLELKETGLDNVFEAITRTADNYKKSISHFYFEQCALGDNWVKKDCDGNLEDLENQAFRFKKLADNIVYLGIPSFDFNFNRKIDSLYQVSEPAILAAKYLIIDVRNNSGGDEKNIEVLNKYIYTNPIQRDTIKYRVGEGNLQTYEGWLEWFKQDPDNFSAEDISDLENHISQLQEAYDNGQKYLETAPPEPISDYEILNNPASILILANHRTGSTAEIFLLHAKQSTKTQIIGTNSAGMIGYGDNGGVSTPCYQFRLTCTMFRYNHRRKYEKIGIAPDVYVNRVSIADVVSRIKRGAFENTIRQ